MLGIFSSLISFAISWFLLILDYILFGQPLKGKDCGLFLPPCFPEPRSLRNDNKKRLHPSEKEGGSSRESQHPLAVSNIAQHDNQEQSASCLCSLARQESKHPNPVGKPSGAITTWPK